MRIAIIAEVFLPKIDGVVNRTLNLIRNLTRAGDDVLVVCPQAPGCADCPVPVVAVPSFSFPLYPEYRIGMPDKRLAEALARFAPDVIHYVNPFAFGFRCHDVLRAGPRSGDHGPARGSGDHGPARGSGDRGPARGSGDRGPARRTPSVFSFHTLYGEFVKQYRVLKPLSALLWWMMREYHNCADVNLTVSSIMQNELVERGFRRVELWPPAVDSDLFHPSRRSAAMRARLSNGRPHRPLLLTVSRLAPEKNVGFLADVLREVPGAALAIVGDGPHRPALERRFDGADAHFIGYLKGEELAAAYASADAFVYASETETMGNVVLEAMAAGCPVVVPRAGGIPSLVAHGKTGLLYRPGDLKESAHLTRTVLGDADLRSRISHAARAWIEERNWEQSIGRVREVYATAIAEGRRAVSPWTWRQRVAQLTLATLLSVFKSLSGDERKVPPQPALRDLPPALLAAAKLTAAVA
jgi:glycosyltransferase involved in cell wall biosynthesis